MNSGNPFYTSDQNPQSPSQDSCLSDMVAGDSCNITWEVTANGTAGTSWNFFGIAEPTTLLNEILNAIKLSPYPLYRKQPANGENHALLRIALPTP